MSAPVQVFRCKNPDCRRTFLFLGRISEEKRPLPSFSPVGTAEVVRVITESPCCPFCYSKDFELAKESKGESK